MMRDSEPIGLQFIAKMPNRLLLYLAAQRRKNEFFVSVA